MHCARLHSESAVGILCSAYGSRHATYAPASTCFGFLMASVMLRSLDAQYDVRDHLLAQMPVYYLVLSARDEACQAALGARSARSARQRPSADLTCFHSSHNFPPVFSFLISHRLHSRPSVGRICMTVYMLAICQAFHRRLPFPGSIRQFLNG